MNNFLMLRSLLYHIIEGFNTEDLENTLTSNLRSGVHFFTIIISGEHESRRSDERTLKLPHFMVYLFIHYFFLFLPYTHATFTAQEEKNEEN